jgi:hypothetical protein
MGRPLLLLLVTFGAICHSQTISVIPSAVDGVEIIGPQSTDYGPMVDQILGSIRSQTLNAWLPFGVVIKNSTSQNLVAVAARWDVTNGRRQTGSRVLEQDLWSQPHQQIPPGGSAVVLPILMVQDASHLPPPFRLTPPAGFVPANNQNPSALQSAQSLKVTLDGVVFASGQFAGPNTAHEFEDFVAKTTIPAEVAAKVLEMRAAGVPVSDVVAWLESTATAHPRQPTASAARQLLQSYKARGETSLCQLAQSESQPVLHIYR